MLVGVIYRPPDRPVSNFNNHLKSLPDIIGTDTPCYLLGDMNINLLNHSAHKETSDYLDIIYSNSFVPLITRPTRVTDHSATLIDHIMTNNFKPSLSLYQGILLTDVSDHYPIFHIVKFNDTTSNENEFILKRNMSAKNFELFHQLISRTNWSDTLNKTECQSSFSAFHNEIKEIYNKSFPLTKIKIGYKTDYHGLLRH